MPDKPAVIKQVRALREREPRIDLHRHPIRIDFVADAVVLEGEVEDIAAKKLALEYAAGIDGVRGVVDRLHVAPAEPKGDGAIRAALIRCAAHRDDEKRQRRQHRNAGVGQAGERARAAHVEADQPRPPDPGARRQYKHRGGHRFAVRYGSKRSTFARRVARAVKRGRQAAHGVLPAVAAAAPAPSAESAVSATAGSRSRSGR